LLFEFSGCVPVDFGKPASESVSSSDDPYITSITPLSRNLKMQLQPKLAFGCTTAVTLFLSSARREREREREREKRRRGRGIVSNPTGK
jgi:hypothetical protein